MNKRVDQFEPTYREKQVRIIKNFVREHKKFKFLGQIAIILVFFITAIGGKVIDNRKRIVAICITCLFFFASSSFSYPTYESDTGEQNPVGLKKELAENQKSISKSDNSNRNNNKKNIDSDNYAEELLVDGNGELLGKVGKDDQISFDQIIISDDQKVDEKANSDEDEKFSSSDWNLILVNKQHPIPEGYQFPTAEVTNGGKVCDARIIEPMKKMFSDARKEGINLVICSPYRSHDRQEMLFNRKVDYYLNNGCDYMDAYTLAAQAVTIPGSSEHELGLAMDIISDNYCMLDEGFGDTPAGKWLENNSYKYGFVVRYLKGKESVTGIEFEPWHMRYVGTAAAKIMHAQNICLEEFWDKYIF
ncbi:M15 family metallopeptidase [Butyrivibrio sp. NC3005]|uniref:M15 family metallopeptidase n=1 Tax=Butyrivibrio sp. NC3005 TaxID=1280685 RepID=UPI0004163704|nr:M15 family metallopeptidase [Butyrivibrio sp. NC3005]